jgi:hypothetical protein
MGAAYHNSKEVYLTSCNHVASPRYVIEHTTNVLVSNLLLFDSRHGYMQELVDIVVEEYFQFVEKRFLHRPSLATPQKLIHGDCTEQEIFAPNL